MNTDKETPCFLSVFICVHPWLIRFAFCGVVAQLDSLAHPNCEDDFRSPEAPWPEARNPESRDHSQATDQDVVGRYFPEALLFPLPGVWSGSDGIAHRLCECGQPGVGERSDPAEGDGA